MASTSLFAMEILAEVEDPVEIVVECEDHYQEEDDETHRLGDLLHLLGDLPADEDLDRVEEDVSTIEDGDGKEVDDAQVDAYEREEEDEITEALLGSLACLLEDEDGPPDVLG